MAFLTKGRDLRGQFERYSSDGSQYVDTKDPNKNNIGGASRSPLITKPFDFDYNQINSRLTDAERFVKFLGTPGGLKMQANIAILQQSGRDLRATFNKNKKVGGTGIGNILRAAKAVALDTIKGNLGFTANVAKQIALNGTGAHFVNNLNGPTYLSEGGDPKSALGKFLKDTVSLPKTAFGMKLGPGAAPIGPDPEGAGTVKSNFVDGKDRLMDSVYDTQPNQSDALLQDPVKAAKDTLSGFAKSANKKLANQLTGGSSGKAVVSDSIPLDSALKASRVSRTKGEIPSPDGTKYRSSDNQFRGTELVEKNESIYQASKAEDTYNVDISSIDVKLNKDGGIGKLDSIKSNTINVQLEDEREIAEALKKDLIPFAFTSITPDKSETLFFQAFLEDYQDNYTANWNASQYIGRGEQFYTYNSSLRTLSFSFKAASFNQENLVTLYKKLNLLAGTTAPNYSESGNFMRGTLTRITLGDLLYRQNGFITSIGLSWEKSFQWEIDAYNEELERVPHVLNVAVQFTPLHSFNVKSDINNEDERYFGKRTINPPKPKPKVRKKKITPENPKPVIPLTPPSPLTVDFAVPNAISDTVQFTTTGQGIDTIGTGDERKRGQKGGYIVD